MGTEQAQWLQLLFGQLLGYTRLASKDYLVTGYHTLDEAGFAALYELARSELLRILDRAFSGDADAREQLLPAVLERTKSHLERRKEEINAALYNAGEGGKKRRGKLFSFENQLEDEDSDDDDSEGEEEDEEEDDEEQEQEQEQEQEEDSEEEEEEEEEEEAPRSRRNRRG